MFSIERTLSLWPIFSMINKDLYCLAIDSYFYRGGHYNPCQENEKKNANVSGEC